MAFFLQVMLSGLALGCIYGLVALGVVVIFSATRLLNFAQGEFLMLGGLVGWWALSVQHLPYVVAIVLVIATGFLAGTVLSKGVVGVLLARGTKHMSIVIATLAVSIVTAQAVLRLMGPSSRSVPSMLSGAAIRLGGATLS